MTTLSYRTIEFSPTGTPEVGINIGVHVTGESGQWLSLLSSEDMNRRCKALTGATIGTHNSLIDSLRAFGRQLSKFESGLTSHFTNLIELPALLAQPERYNNMVRVSDPNTVIYGKPKETAEFLLHALAPVDTPERNQQVTTVIRHRFSTLIAGHDELQAAARFSPRLVVNEQNTRLMCGFEADGVRMLTQAFNFDRSSNLEQLQAQANSLNYFVGRMRSGRASLQPKDSDTTLSVPAEVPFDLVYRRPSDRNSSAQKLLDAMRAEWVDLDIRAIPDDEIEMSVALASRILA